MRMVTGTTSCAYEQYQTSGMLLALITNIACGLGLDCLINRLLVRIFLLSLNLYMFDFIELLSICMVIVIGLI